MIILKNISFQKMIRFLHDNICEMPAQFVVTDAEQETKEGFMDYLVLLDTIYSDYASREVDDIRATYESLLNALKFLFGCFTVGTVQRVNDGYELMVRKSELKTVYKGGSVGKISEFFCRFGLITTFSRNHSTCSLSKATELLLSSTRHPSLIPALKHFTDLIHDPTHEIKDCICDKVAMFIKGDYETAAQQMPGTRDSLDPLRPDIQKTMGCHRENWWQLVDVMVNTMGWTCSGFVHYHCSPSWGVSFFEKGKRPTAIFTLGSEIIFIELTVPVDAAEEIIRNRSHYADSIRQHIESFRCVQCPKHCRGKNIVMIDGVMLCTGRAEARRIYMHITTPSEISSIISIMETMSCKL